MRNIREIPNVREDYHRLRKELDLLCNQISSKGYEMNATVESLSGDKEIISTINKIRMLKKDCIESANAKLETPEAKAQLKINFRKLSRDNNPYCTAKKGTLNEVFSDCFMAMNYLKLEIGLISIEATNGKVEDAKTLSRKAIRSISANSANDSVIFSSALSVAKIDGVKLDETKIK